MKTIPVQLLTTFKKPGRSVCYLVKLVDKEGAVHGFASLDAIVNFNDGLHSVAYQPDQEMRPQNIQQTSDMDVDNTELVGWFNDAMEELVVAGMFSGAEITIYRVSYHKLSEGAEIVAYGTVGEVQFNASKGGKRRIEFRSLVDDLKQKVNDQYSLTCRADFGDDKCGMPFVWEDATVAEVDDNFMRFRISGVTQPDGWFDFGVIWFVDGNNAGKTMEIEEWTSDGWVKLAFVTPYPIEVGVSVKPRRDCPKTEQACYDYGNMVNMRAEHLTPVQEQALMVPGAYIKSNNAL